MINLTQTGFMCGLQSSIKQSLIYIKFDHNELGDILITTVTSFGKIEKWNIQEKEQIDSKSLRLDSENPQFQYSNFSTQKDKKEQETKKPPIKLNKDPEEPLSCFFIDESYYYGGQLDGKLQIWNFQCEKKFEVLDSKQQIVAINKLESLIFTGSFDLSIRFYETEDFTQVKVVKIPDFLNEYQIIDNKITFLVGSSKIMIMNEKQEQIEKGVMIPNQVVTSYYIQESTLLVALATGNLEIYDIEKFPEELSQEIKPIQTSFNKLFQNIIAIRKKQNLLFLAQDSGAVLVLDFKQNLNVVDKLLGHKKGINQMEIVDEKYLITIGEDGLTISWNIIEIQRKVVDRMMMFKEDLWSKKHEVWYNLLFKKKSKKKKKGK